MLLPSFEPPFCGLTLGFLPLGDLLLPLIDAGHTGSAFCLAAAPKTLTHCFLQSRYALKGDKELVWFKLCKTDLKDVLSMNDNMTTQILSRIVPTLLLLYLLEIVCTHLSIAPVAMEALQTPWCSFLTWIKVFTLPLTVIKLAHHRRKRIAQSWQISSYFSNVSLTLAFHGVSSDVSLEAITLLCVVGVPLKCFYSWFDVVVGRPLRIRLRGKLCLRLKFSDNLSLRQRNDRGVQAMWTFVCNHHDRVLDSFQRSRWQPFHLGACTYSTSGCARKIY